MPGERTSKALSERVEITFQQRPNRPRQLRWRWSLAALAVSLVLPAVGAIRGERKLYQAGPVSPPHQLVANDCRQCHDRSWQPLARLVSFDEGRVSTSDDACKACHDGEIHHPNQTQPPPCAGCHREHRGRAGPARVDDAACVECHADLETKDGSTTSFIASISDFAGHPEFAVKRANDALPKPGKGHKVHDVAGPKPGGGWQDNTPLRFNHAKHLPEAGVLVNDGTQKREWLKCEDCHRVDRSSGYIEPIDHDRHCARCHQNTLNFDYLRALKEHPGDGPSGSSGTRYAADAVHGSVAQVHAKLIEFYVQYVKEHPEAAAPEAANGEPPWEIPGGGGLPLTQNDWTWVTKRVADAQRLLLANGQKSGCRYCHTEVAQTAGAWRVEPPRIPNRWLAHGTFRHDSHTLLSCTACHDAAIASRETSDVLLPGIDECRKCHAASPPAGKQGAARADCIECHDYHGHAGDRYDGRLSLELTVVKPDHRRERPSRGRREGGGDE